MFPAVGGLIYTSAICDLNYLGYDILRILYIHVKKSGQTLG